MPREPGTYIEGYRIDELLGVGGMGEVYRATEGIGHAVALKILSPERTDTRTRDRFEQEAKVMAKLSHPSILRLYLYIPTEPCIVMELVRGGTLADRISAGRIPLDLANRWCVEIADALATAHKIDVIHRDLKPANIFLTEDGHVKLADFGLATQIGGVVSETATTDPRLTPRGLLVGTRGYLAPEVCQGASASFQSDQYAFGVVIHELFSGARPVVDASGNVRIVEAFLPAVHALLARCLASVPDARFACADDFRRAVHAAVTFPAIVSGASQPVPEVEAVDRTVKFLEAATRVREVRIWGYSLGWAKPILRALENDRYSNAHLTILHPSKAALRLFHEVAAKQQQNSSTWKATLARLEGLPLAQIDCLEARMVPDSLGVLIDGAYLLLGRYSFVQRDGILCHEPGKRPERPTLVYTQVTKDGAALIDHFNCWWICRASEAHLVHLRPNPGEPPCTGAQIGGAPPGGESE